MILMLVVGYSYGIRKAVLARPPLAMDLRELLDAAAQEDESGNSLRTWQPAPSRAGSGLQARGELGDGADGRSQRRGSQYAVFETTLLSFRRRILPTGGR